jgi:S-adenosylmethionine-diacylglycerol 3-amino-3-carboxypropyl transferase
MSAATLVPLASAPRVPARRGGEPLVRATLDDALDDRLFFAQVREDPRGELEALAPTADDTVVVVSSGGCTALSLLAAGAGRVVAVDRNATQNHIVELKAAAAALGAANAIAFLGGRPSASRPESYAALRGTLNPPARRFWDARPRDIASGVLTAGVSEQFIGAVVAALESFVHPRRRIERLLACDSVDEQRALFEREWNTRRWRALFVVLCNRLVFRGTYPPAFFTHLEHASFSGHFRGVADHAISDLPVRENYFLHQMLTGHYPVGVDGGVPPYLSADGSAAVTACRQRLALVDGSMTSYLRSCADRSVDCFALSNICEWMSDTDVVALFREVLRTAAPGARLVYRNFLGWTEPPAGCERIVQDPALGARLSLADRSAMQRRLVTCRIVEAP